MSLVVSMRQNFRTAQQELSSILWVALTLKYSVRIGLILTVFLVQSNVSKSFSPENIYQFTIFQIFPYRIQ